MIANAISQGALRPEKQDENSEEAEDVINELTEGLRSSRAEIKE